MPMDMNKYIPMIRSHYINGVPCAELSDLEGEQQTLADIFNLYEMYKQNPFINISEWAQKKYGYGWKKSIEIKRAVEYIDLNFSAPTRKELENKTLHLIDNVAKSALQAGDRHDQLEAARLYMKVGQLDKPAPEASVASNTARLPIVITSDVKVIDPDRENYIEEQRSELLRKYGGTPDQIALLVKQNTEELMNNQETFIKEEDE